MEKDYLYRGDYDIQYYNFGSGRELVFVRNVEPHNMLVYDGVGTLLTPPFTSDFPVSVMFYESSQQFHIYAAQNDHLYLLTLQKGR